MLVGIDRANRFRSEAVEKRLEDVPRATDWRRLDASSSVAKPAKRRAGELFRSQTPPKQRRALACEGGSAVKETSDLLRLLNAIARFGRPPIPSCFAGIRKANQCEREAVDKVLGEFSELRIGAIWARLRRLRYRAKDDRATPVDE